MSFIKYNSQWHLSGFWFAWHLHELSAYSLMSDLRSPHGWKERREQLCNQLKF